MGEVKKTGNRRIKELQNLVSFLEKDDNFEKVLNEELKSQS